MKNFKIIGKIFIIIGILFLIGRCLLSTSFFEYIIYDNDIVYGSELKKYFFKKQLSMYGISTLTFGVILTKLTATFIREIEEMKNKV